MLKPESSPIPVDLWVPDYYKKKPKDLCNNVLTVSEKSLAIARFAAHSIIDSLIFHDPQGILEALDTDPYIRVANHLDFTDPIVLGMVNDALGLPPPRYAAMAELFSAEHPHIADFIASLGAFPVDRARMSSKELRVVVHFARLVGHILNELREPIDLFPEGGITPKPRNYPNKVGPISDSPLRLCETFETPLVIVGISGTRHAALRAIAPIKPVKVGVYVSKIYDHDELPTPLKLQMDMQTAANVAQTLIR